MTQIMVLIYTDITRRDFVSVCWASGSRNWITAYLTEINYFDALQYLLSFLRWLRSLKHIWFFPWMHRSPSHWRTVSNIHLFTHQETWFRMYGCIGYSFNYCLFQNTLVGWFEEVKAKSLLQLPLNLADALWRWQNGNPKMCDQLTKGRTDGLSYIYGQVLKILGGWKIYKQNILRLSDAAFLKFK